MSLPKLLLSIALLASFPFSAVKAWDNDLDGPLNVQCPPNEYIWHILSVHENKQEDRLWDFTCRPASAINISDFCFWTGYVNNYDEPMDFECPHQAGRLYLITGVSSIHDNEYEDRIWDYNCCEVQNCNAECALGPYANIYDGPMDYTVPEGHYLNGAKSEHDNHDEDRIWQFRTCRCATLEDEEDYDI